MLRRVIKTGVAGALHGSGMGSWIGAHTGKGQMPLIVGYHRVVDEFRKHTSTSMAPMLISLETLERQLDWLGRRFTFVSLAEVAKQASQDKTSGKPLAAVTFDDGYRDVYEYAFPLLKRKGIPLALFVITDFVGTPRLQVHDELYQLLSQVFAAWEEPKQKLTALLRDVDVDERIPAIEPMSTDEACSITRVLLKSLTRRQLQLVVDTLRSTLDSASDKTGEFRMLDWEQLIEMQRAGVIIGSHTCSHALLTNEPHGKALHETRDSRVLLEHKLGVTVEHFAYPDGRYNREAVDAVAAAGYRYAYGTCSHRDPHHPELTIPRRIMWEGSCQGAFSSFSPSVMHCHINGVFDFATRCGASHAT